MKINKEITEKVEAQLVACKLSLYQLENSDNMTEEHRTTRHQLMDFYLSNIEKLLRLDIGEHIDRFTRDLDIKPNNEDGKQ